MVQGYKGLDPVGQELVDEIPVIPDAILIDGSRPCKQGKRTMNLLTGHFHWLSQDQNEEAQKFPGDFRWQTKLNGQGD